MTRQSITDFHAHVFSRPFFEALAAKSPLAGSPGETLDRVAETVGLELPSPDLKVHLARWLESLDKGGVQRMAAFSSDPAETPAVLEMAAASSGRMVPIAVCDPSAPGTAERLAPLFESKGLRGLLLFPAVHHYHMGDESLRPVLDLIEAHQAVVYVHCGILVVKLKDLLGLPRAYDLTFANPLGVIPAAERYPGATFCIPHFGAGFFRETLIAGAQSPNIVTDTSSTNSWIRTHPGALNLTDVLTQSLEVFGSERVLFGTDSNIFPQGWRRDRFEQWRQIADGIGMSEADRSLFFQDNAERLLGAVATTGASA